jgi:hypothetical protein
MAMLQLPSSRPRLVAAGLQVTHHCNSTAPHVHLSMTVSTATRDLLAMTVDSELQLTKFKVKVILRPTTSQSFILAIYPWHRLHRKHSFQQFFYCFMHIRCHGHVLIEPLPNNGRLFWVHHSTFQVSCHNIYLTSWGYTPENSNLHCHLHEFCCIRRHGNLFTKPLPSKDGGIQIQTQRLMGGIY